jgi:chromosome segregation ATPase
MIDINELREKITIKGLDVVADTDILEILDRLEEAESDALEQARLNGMGGEREAALMAKLEAAEKERDFAKTEIARLHDDIRELTDVLVLDEEDSAHHKALVESALRVAKGWEGKCRELRTKIETAEKERDALRSKLEAVEKELEVERMRLAACGVAALGYFNGCAKEYESASLYDVMELRAKNDALRAKVEAMEKQEPAGYGVLYVEAANGEEDWDSLWKHRAFAEDHVKDFVQTYSDLGESIGAITVVPLYLAPGAKGE